MQQGRRVYYRCWKTGGRVMRAYVGGGRKGELAAQADARRRRERETRQQAQRDTLQRWKDSDAAVVHSSDAIDLLFRAALVAAGYYQHNRGAWRRRRDVA